MQVVTAIILRHSTEFSSSGGQLCKSGWRQTASLQPKWQLSKQTTVT